MKIFEKIKKKIDKLDSFFDTTQYFYRTVDSFIKRQQSMRTSLMRPTKVYSPQYFVFRTAMGFTNPRHSYFLSGKLHNTLKLFMKDREFYFYSQADYLSFLFEGTLGRKYFHIVEEAWRISNREKDILVSEIVSKIYLYVNTSKI